MPSFVFNIDQVLGSAAAGGAALNTNLYANTPDSALVYSGNDPLVWDRVNAERLRRGLPSLTAIGSPRPPEETDTAQSGPPTDTFGNAKQFTVSGETLTRDEAFRIFSEQVKSGGLTGFKAGDALSAATQAADGLTGALGQVTTGTSLTGGIGNLGTNLQASIAGLKDAIVNTPLTNPINVGDYAKGVPSFGDLENINANQVTGSLASVAKLVGQSTTLLSDAKGLGKYGLDASQLETAGYLKPGTVAKYINTGTNTLTSVLTSPNVWSGKDGVMQVEDLLLNKDTQTKIQQTLMTTGLEGMRTLGVPVDQLPPQLTTGLSLAAAKDVASAVDWARGQSNAITAPLKETFDKLAKDSSYAVQYVNERVGLPTLGVEKIEGSVNTVDRTTVNAAVSRVLGNEKIPALNYGGTFIDQILEQQLKDLLTLTIAVENRANTIFAEEITPDNVDAREARMRALIAAVNALLGQLQGVKLAAQAASRAVPAFVTKVDNAIASAQLLLDLINKELDIIAQFKQGLQSI